MRVDANSNLLTLTPPGRPAHSFSYTSRDLTEQYTPPSATPGGPTSYGYNADEQPTITTRPDGDVISSGYDLAGRLSTMTIPRGSFGYGYDGPTGKLLSVTGPGGSSRSYNYQGSLLTSLSSGGPVSGTAAWTYDNNFRTTSHTLNGANGIAFSYDADELSTAVGSLTLGRNAQNGLLTGTTQGSVTDAMTYSTFAEVSDYTASAGASQLYSESYVRDNLGRITQRTETIQGTTTVWGYGYDAAGRLVNVTRNGAAFESYTYDANDNRLTKTTAAGTTTYGTDDQDRLLSAVGPEGASSWMYDANGDLLQRNDSSGQTSFDYDTTGQLLSLTKPDGDVVSYELDAGNKRAVKKVNGVLQRKWLYAGGLLPVAEYDANDNLTTVFNGGYMVKNGTTYRLLRDHLGSVRLVVDVNTGAVAQRLSYGPWGNVTEDTNPGFQPFGFAGGLYDPHTGLVRFGARDFDPASGRWTCKDPVGLGSGANVYSYCSGDPINFVDRTGLAISVETDSSFEMYGIKPVTPQNIQKANSLVKALRKTAPGEQLWNNLSGMDEYDFRIIIFDNPLAPRTGGGILDCEGNNLGVLNFEKKNGKWRLKPGKYYIWVSPKDASAFGQQLFVLLGHEMGHSYESGANGERVFGQLDSGDVEGQERDVINNWENPIRRAVGLPERTKPTHLP